MSDFDLPVEYGRIAERNSSILGSLDPEMAHFANAVGSTVKNRANANDILDWAYKGKTPQDIAEEADVEKSAQEAMRMAKETEHLSQQEFDTLLGQMQETVNTRPTPPSPTEPQNITPWQAAFTLLGMSAAPHAVFDVAGAPFRANQQAALRQDQHNQQVYESDIAARKEQMGMLQTRAGFAQDKVQQAQSEIRRISQELGRMADEKRSRGLAVESALFGLRQDAYEATTPEKLAGAIRGIQDLVKKYPQFASHELSIEEINGLQENINAHLQADAQSALAKESTARNNTLAYQFNGEYRSYRTTAGEVTPTDVIRFNSKRKQLIEAGVPSYMLDDPVAGKTAATDRQDAQFEYRKSRDQISDDRWVAANVANNTIVMQPDGSWIPNPNKVSGANRKKEFAKAQDAVEKAKTQTRIAIQKPGASLMDRKNLNSIIDKIQNEYEAVRTKRLVAGVTEDGGLEDYIAVVYPDVHKAMLAIDTIGKATEAFGVAPQNPFLKGDITPRGSGKGVKQPPKANRGVTLPPNVTVRTTGG